MGSSVSRIFDPRTPLIISDGTRIIPKCILSDLIEIISNVSNVPLTKLWRAGGFERNFELSFLSRKEIFFYVTDRFIIEIILFWPREIHSINFSINVDIFLYDLLA